MKVTMKADDARKGKPDEYQFQITANLEEMVTLLKEMVIGMRYDSREDDAKAAILLSRIMNGDGPRMDTRDPLSVLLMESCTLFKSTRIYEESHGCAISAADEFGVVVLDNNKGAELLMSQNSELSRKNAIHIWKGMNKVEKFKLFLSAKGLL